MCPKVYQAWIQYPDTIKNNKIVFPKHIFHGFNESYCSTIKGGIGENERPGTSFYTDVPKFVATTSFVCVEQKHKEKRWWVSGSKGFSDDLTYPPSPTDGMGNSE